MLSYPEQYGSFLDTCWGAVSHGEIVCIFWEFYWLVRSSFDHSQRSLQELSKCWFNHGLLKSQLFYEERSDKQIEEWRQGLVQQVHILEQNWPWDSHIESTQQKPHWARNISTARSNQKLVKLAIICKLQAKKLEYTEKVYLSRKNNRGGVVKTILPVA